MNRLKLMLFAAMMPLMVDAQEFTLANEYAKQLKYYPFVRPFEGDTCGFCAEYNVEYANISGRRLTVDVFLPDSKPSGTMPVLLMVHGGGWRSGSKEMDHPIARSLAARGLAVVCVDYRKSAEALYPAAVEDVACAVRWVRSVATRYAFDTNRITIAGTSAGGQLAALIGSVNGRNGLYGNGLYADQSSAVARVIDIDGVLAFIHPLSSEGQDRPGKPSAATQWFGCAVQDCAAKWNDVSALHNVWAGSADFLFISSDRPRFSAGRTEMVSQLRRMGRSATVQCFGATPHTFWLFEPWAPQVVELMVDFCK